MKPRILITGATGFIGRQCLAPLLGRGFEVHALARDPGPAIQGVAWHACDLMSGAQVDGLIHRVQATHLLHLAWVTAHGQFWHSPDNSDWLRVSIHLMESFAGAGGRHILATGSCAEYDWNRDDCTPFKESDPCRPATPYGQAKMSLYNWLEDFAAAGNIRHTWARLFLLFGEGENPERIVPYLVRSALSGRTARCTAGNQIRDFLDTGTAGRMLAGLATSDTTGAVNLASGVGVSVKDLAAMISRAAGRELHCEFGAIPERQGDPACLVADISRLRAACPEIAGFKLEKSLGINVDHWRTVSGEPDDPHGEER